MTNLLTYEFDFCKYNKHLVDVKLSFISKNHDPIIWLPSWLAGSYLMREFSRNITAVFYKTINDTELKRADKISKNEWQLKDVEKEDEITVIYEVYCYDLSVRTAYVDNQRIFGNFSSLALAVETQEDDPVQVVLSIPTSFYEGKSSVVDACGLPTYYEEKNKIIFKANNYDELIDHPFEIAEQSVFSFITKDSKNQEIPHRFFISGRHVVNQERLDKDVQKICQTYVKWLEDTPFSHYTFMTFASGNDYGGLEHINSTALVTPRSDLPSDAETEEPSSNYQRYLGLCSHEYFHSWWVKTIKPDVMIDVDLRKEVYTPLLWVFEGFTSYIDDFMLQASGVISKESYLKLLEGQINRYNQTEGRFKQSVAESSFDAWIKLYRADENTGNAGVSYYNKGALVSLCLDLLLLENTDNKYRLFDVIKSFYEKAKATENCKFGMNNENLSKVISEFIDAELWQEFYNKYIIGLDPLPVNEFLEKNGLSILVSRNTINSQQPWGMVVSESTQGMTIKKISRDSMASNAGLSAKDIIIAIDDLKADKQQLIRVANRQIETRENIRCHAFRRDELMEFIVPASPNRELACESLGKVTLKINNSTITDIWLEGLKRY